VEPALRVPLTYNLAFGGADIEKPEVFHGSNPIGAGFSAGLPRDGEPMHQLEWTDEPVRSAADRVSPASRWPGPRPRCAGAGCPGPRPCRPCRPGG
jgi:hypothetical protein